MKKENEQALKEFGMMLLIGLAILSLIFLISIIAIGWENTINHIRETDMAMGWYYHPEYKITIQECTNETIYPQPFCANQSFSAGPNETLYYSEICFYPSYCVENYSGNITKVAIEFSQKLVCEDKEVENITYISKNKVCAVIELEPGKSVGMEDSFEINVNRTYNELSKDGYRTGNLINDKITILCIQSESKCYCDAEQIISKKDINKKWLEENAICIKCNPLTRNSGNSCDYYNGEIIECQCGSGCSEYKYGNYTITKT